MSDSVTNPERRLFLAAGVGSALAASGFLVGLSEAQVQLAGTGQEAVVLIPGIMGTRLVLREHSSSQPEEIWPPTPLETVRGYRRIDKLLSPKVEPGSIIDHVLCYNFYSLLTGHLARLGFKDTNNDKRLYLFPYDWRKDLFETADRLADYLDRIYRARAKKIAIVAHSMGGLVARLTLESGRYEDRPWFRNITTLVCIATPHRGAPLALGRIIGIDSTLGVSAADFKRFAADQRYPSGYQLLPPQGETFCWNQKSVGLSALDIYDPATARSLGLNPVMLSRNTALHSALGVSRPEWVRYFLFGGVGHRTATRLNVFAREDAPLDPLDSILTLAPDAGDGTVPLTSALGLAGQAQIVVNEHATVFKGGPFARVFFRLLGGDLGDATEYAGSPKPGSLQLMISTEGPVVLSNRSIEVVLSVDDGADGLRTTSRIEGELILEDLGPKGEVLRIERRTGIRYAGPGIGRIRVELDPIQKPGQYRIRFDGSPKSSGPAFFVATEAQ